MAPTHFTPAVSDFSPVFESLPFEALPAWETEATPSTIDELKEALSNYVDLNGSGGVALEIGLDALEHAAGKQQIIYEASHVQHLVLNALRNPINSESPCEIILAAVGVWGLTENLDSETRMNLMSLLEACFSVVDQNNSCDA
ncbi:hypothetical protein [Allochromatium tepidum]|uniref:Uncharacterized protein n=1 Tax=Allochromatium tepidum TaxID=553982 RepID=A0ABN6GFN0_9GAMM|nr:hypothetical protein [Allochromatium tepidum]BCU08327.1 hypothetical protein Atep_30040 [Allochromatium tepidum]